MLDIIDRGADAVIFCLEKTIPLRLGPLGYIDVVKRSQEVLKLIRTDHETPTSSQRRVNDSLLAQVTNLRQELQLLASNRPVTIVTTSDSVWEVQHVSFMALREISIHQGGCVGVVMLENIPDGILLTESEDKSEKCSEERTVNRFEYAHHNRRN